MIKRVTLPFLSALFSSSSQDLPLIIKQNPTLGDSRTHKYKMIIGLPPSASAESFETGWLIEVYSLSPKSIRSGISSSLGLSTRMRVPALAPGGVQRGLNAILASSPPSSLSRSSRIVTTLDKSLLSPPPNCSMKHYQLVAVLCVCVSERET